VNQQKRAVITGVGVVAPNGTGKDGFWKGLMEGRSATKRITRFPVDRFASHVGGEITDFKPHQSIYEKDLEHMDRAFQMGVTAALLAVEDSGIDFSREDCSRAGVYMGLAVAGIDIGEAQFHVLRDQGLAGVRSHLYHIWFPSACSGYISLKFGLYGQSHVISTGCTSSMDAFGVALQAIRSGQEDIALIGGSEAPLTPLALNAFCAMRALSTRNDAPERASRPFDRERDGFVLGEGSAVLTLESMEHAKKRGARIYAELAGYGTTSNAFHMTAPEPSGEQEARCFRQAIEDAGINPAEVQYMNVHGSSTPLNEKVETIAIKSAFKNHAAEMAVSSIKSMIGHSLGSAGAIQSAACALAFERKAIPPTINYEFPDPECDLDVVPNTARDIEPNVLMANSAGFSGKNSAVVFRKVA
jgi:3-oxoacyl-[acyl-carrier-protein] synthase II